MPVTKKIILASTSSRRQKLLNTLGLSFIVKKIAVNEKIEGAVNPQKAILKNAEKKVAAAAKGESEGLVLGADTMILLGKEAIGKPKDFAEALKTLAKLSGKTHKVITVLVVFDIFSRQLEKRVVISDVSFLKIPPQTLKDYIVKFKPYDKAGAYAIQEDALFWVKEIKGSITNILGLPLEMLVSVLQKFGLTF
ncbi:septum formation protein Maf [candidate division WWE3 bacterium CG_4_8_14_3_um_filter_42_11]|uniref:dTTP/UTP pyrophosphatase n=1 Tax=candidate division WWE3 bacterium CG_4_8_14_3_um_filter_42_11 TaxID=1975076 RepID=A0A2M8G5K0_UNCKA|nr:MAG: septum formation protein Maf [candidate division WWE3 bacterium CG_4_8_14_3_um_filter_42_11]